MAKGKGKGSSSGPRKSHGPKKHLFAYYKPMIKQFADCGLLSKYHNYDSWVMACNSRGKKSATKEEFKAFRELTREQQDAWFKNISSK